MLTVSFLNKGGPSVPQHAQSLLLCGIQEVIQGDKNRPMFHGAKEVASASDPEVAGF